MAARVGGTLSCWGLGCPFPPLSAPAWGLGTGPCPGEHGGAGVGWGEAARGSWTLCQRRGRSCAGGTGACQGPAWHRRCRGERCRAPAPRQGRGTARGASPDPVWPQPLPPPSTWARRRRQAPSPGLRCPSTSLFPSPGAARGARRGCGSVAGPCPSLQDPPLVLSTPRPIAAPAAARAQTTHVTQVYKARWLKETELSEKINPTTRHI